MDLTGKAMKIAMGIILLVAVIVPFISMASVSNTTATPTVLGMPSTAYNLILLVIIVVFAFMMVKSKTK